MYENQLKFLAAVHSKPPTEEISDVAIDLKLSKVSSKVDGSEWTVPYSTLQKKGRKE